MLFKHWYLFRSLSSGILQLSFILFMLVLVEGIIWYILPPYLEKSVVLEVAGIILASYGVSSFLTQLPAGDLADKINRKFTFILGVLIFILSLVVLLFFKSSFGLFIFMCLLGCGSTLISVGSFNTVMDLSKSNLGGEVAGIYSTFNALGWALGSIFGGIILYFLDVSSFVKITLFIIFLILLWVILNYPEKKNFKFLDLFKSVRILNHDRLYLKELSAISHLKLLFFAFTFFSFAFGFYEYTMWTAEPIYMASIGANVILGGLILSLTTFPYLFFSYFVGYLTDKVGWRLIVIFGIIMILFAHLYFIFFSSSSLWELTFTFLFVSLGSVFTFIPFDAYVRANIKKGLRAESFGFSGTLYDCGGIVAPLMLGLVGGDIVDFRKVFLGTFVIFLISGILLLYFILHHKFKYKNSKIHFL